MKRYIFLLLILVSFAGYAQQNIQKLTAVRILNANSTARVVKATPGEVWGISIQNLHSAAIYVKFYNIAAASVNPVSSVPIFTLQIAANGSAFIMPGMGIFRGSTALSVRAVTDAGDTGTTAPGTLPIIELKIL